MITDAYPHREKPHIAIPLHEEAKILNKIGQLRVQTLIRTEKLRFGYRKYSWEGVEVEALEMPYRAGMGFIFLPLAVLLHFLLSLKNIIFFKPDAVILQMSLPHGLGYLPLSFFKKYVVIERSSRILNAKGIFALPLKWAYKVYSVSKFHAQNIEKKLGVKVDGIVPNAIATDIPSNGMENRKGKFKRIIFVGRLDENKSPDLFINAAKILKDYEFVLIGEAINEEYLKNLPDNVIYKGPLSNEEVLQEIYRSDILVSTSKYEASARVIAEALSMGKPVVWTYSGGPGDYLDEENSVLVKERTPESLAKSILEAYKKLDTGYFDSDTIRKKILDYAGPDRMIKVYKNILKSFK